MIIVQLAVVAARCNYSTKRPRDQATVVTSVTNNVQELSHRDPINGNWCLILPGKYQASKYQTRWRDICLNISQYNYVFLDA